MAGFGVAVECKGTLLISITVAAPVGWGRLVGMSAASFRMADTGGSGTGRIRGQREKLCFHKYGLCARAVRAPVSVEGFIGTCGWDTELQTRKKIL